MTTADAITLFDHEDGHRSMKLGRYDDTTSEETEIVELENAVPKATVLANWELSDFPERILEFFNLNRNGNGSEADEWSRIIARRRPGRGSEELTRRRPQNLD